MNRRILKISSIDQSVKFVLEYFKIDQLETSIHLQATPWSTLFTYKCSLFSESTSTPTLCPANKLLIFGPYLLLILTPAWYTPSPLTVHESLFRWSWDRKMNIKSTNQRRAFSIVKTNQRLISIVLYKPIRSRSKLYKPIRDLYRIVSTNQRWV